MWQETLALGQMWLGTCVTCNITLAFRTSILNATAVFQTTQPAVISIQIFSLKFFVAADDCRGWNCRGNKERRKARGGGWGNFAFVQRCFLGISKSKEHPRKLTYLFRPVIFQCKTSYRASCMAVSRHLKCFLTAFASKSLPWISPLGTTSGSKQSGSALSQCNQCTGRLTLNGLCSSQFQLGHRSAAANTNSETKESCILFLFWVLQTLKASCGIKVLMLI